MYDVTLNYGMKKIIITQADFRPGMRFSSGYVQLTVALTGKPFSPQNHQIVAN